MSSYLLHLYNFDHEGDAHKSYRTTFTDTGKMKQFIVDHFVEDYSDFFNCKMSVKIIKSNETVDEKLNEEIVVSDSAEEDEEEKIKDGINILENFTYFLLNKNEGRLATYRYGDKSPIIHLQSFQNLIRKMKTEGDTCGIDEKDEDAVAFFSDWVFKNIELGAPVSQKGFVRTFKIKGCKEDSNDTFEPYYLRMKPDFPKIPALEQTIQT